MEAKITPKEAVTEQIIAMLQNNILQHNGGEPFNGWCEDGEIFENTYPNMDEEFYKECERLMHKVSPYIDKLTYDFLEDRKFGIL